MSASAGSGPLAIDIRVDCQHHTVMDKEKLFPATIMPGKDWWHYLWPDQEAALRAVGIGPDMQVVDLCCGDGHFTRPMCEEETTVLDQPRGTETDLRMEPEDVRAVVEPAGFIFERIVEVGPYHYGAIFTKHENDKV